MSRRRGGEVGFGGGTLGPYMLDVRAFELLGREGEVAVGTEAEAGEEAMREAAVEARAAVGIVLAYAPALRRRRPKPERLVGYRDLRPDGRPAYDDAGALLERLAELERLAAGAGTRAAQVDLLRSLGLARGPVREIADRVAEYAELFRAARSGGGADDEIAAVEAEAGQPEAEILALHERILAGRERARRARQLLVERNLRLVVSIAAGQGERGLELSDLVQEGNLGLICAAERFDYRRGFRFSTYATWWIVQHVSRATANKGRTIRVPIHQVEMLAQVLQTERRLTQELGRKPRLDEVATVLDLEPAAVGLLLTATLEPVSLDAPIGEEGGASLADLVADGDAPCPEALTAREQLRRRLRRVVTKLPPREEKVLRMRFGLTRDPADPIEPCQTGKPATRERLLQMEAAALRRLRPQAAPDQ